jgi:uncharacterized protein with PIN domain
VTDVAVRIYGLLNDFLPVRRRHVIWDHFETCSGCGRVHWKGSHWKRLQHTIDGAGEEAVSPSH